MSAWEKDANGFESTTDLITAYTRFLQDNNEELYIRIQVLREQLKGTWRVQNRCRPQRTRNTGSRIARREDKEGPAVTCVTRVTRALCSFLIYTMTQYPTGI